MIIIFRMKYFTDIEIHYENFFVITNIFQYQVVMYILLSQI